MSTTTQRAVPPPATGGARRARASAPAPVTLLVEGMTCSSCERKIAKRLRAVDGVVAADVSARRGSVTVRTDRTVPRERLTAAVEAAGYAVVEQAGPWLTRDRRVWRDVALGAGAVALLVLLLQVTGAAGLADQVGTLATSGSLVLIVVLGLAAGLSTCMALVGGLVLTLSASHAARHPEASTAGRMRPSLVFTAGRLAGFAVLGAATGWAGSLLSLGPHTVALLMIVVSLVMVGVGLRLTGLSPRLSGAASVALPAGVTRVLRLDSAGGTYSDARTAALGAGTYLLPCGFTQAVQVYAMSTGSPSRAALVMTLFALGTAPGIVGIGGLTALARGGFADRFLRFAGVAVLAFAAVNASGSLAVMAPGIFAPVGGGPVLVESDDPAEVVTPDVTLSGQGQVLRTTQVADGYEPAHAVVLAGRPLRWEIESVALTCAASLWSQDLGIAPQLLDPGATTVIDLELTEPGTYRYSCGMGMYWGSITVVADPAA